MSEKEDYLAKHPDKAFFIKGAEDNSPLNFKDPLAELEIVKAYKKEKEDTFTLSDKINISYRDMDCNDILVADVKEFIKRVKEELRLEVKGDHPRQGEMEGHLEILDKLAGKELV